MGNDRTDRHLDTGEYDPQRYWNARAKSADGNTMRAVCVFRALNIENRAADAVQMQLMKRVLDRILPHIHSALEFGCGAGRWVPLFNEMGIAWHGIDISQEMIDLATQAHPDISIRKMDGRMLPHADAAFDLVYTITVVHHNPYHEQEQIMEELARVTRPGGYLILLEGLLRQDNDKHHFNMFPRTLDQWVSLAEQNSLSYIMSSGGRYWIFRDIASIFFRKAVYIKPIRWCLGYLDSMFSPSLQKLIPQRYHNFALMLFRKPDS